MPAQKRRPDFNIVHPPGMPAYTNLNPRLFDLSIPTAIPLFCSQETDKINLPNQKRTMTSN